MLRQLTGLAVKYTSLRTLTKTNENIIVVLSSELVFWFVMFLWDFTVQPACFCETRTTKVLIVLRAEQVGAIF